MRDYRNTEDASKAGKREGGVMQRILQDYLTLPVYLVKQWAGDTPYSNVTLFIHVDAVQQLMDGNIADIDNPAPVAKLITYPPVDFQIVVSGVLLHHLLNIEPRLGVSDGFLDEADYQKQIETWRKERDNLMDGLAGTVIHMWKKAVASAQA